MKSGQAAIFEWLPDAFIFNLQDGMFHFVWVLVLYAFWRGRTPAWSATLGILAASIVYDALDIHENAWHLVNQGRWLSEINEVAFNRLTFFYYIYLATYIALVVRFCLAPRPWRTVFRMFAMTIGMVSIVTFTLFHTTVITGGLYEARAQRQLFMTTLLESDAPRAQVQAVCRAQKMWCRYTHDPLTLEMDPPEALAAQGIDVTGRDYAYTQMEMQDAMAQALAILKPDAPPIFRDRPRVTWAGMYALDPDHFRLGLFQSVAVYVDKRGPEWLVIIDKAGFDDLTDRFTLYTAILILAAHAAWLFGGLVLCWLHEMAVIHRIARRADVAARLAATGPASRPVPLPAAPGPAPRPAPRPAQAPGMAAAG